MSGAKGCNIAFKIEEKQIQLYQNELKAICRTVKLELRYQEQLTNSRMAEQRIQAGKVIWGDGISDIKG